MSTTTTTSTGTHPKTYVNPAQHEAQTLLKHEKQQRELWGPRKTSDEGLDVNEKILIKLIEEFTTRMESNGEISGWAQNAYRIGSICAPGFYFSKWIFEWGSIDI